MATKKEQLEKQRELARLEMLKMERLTNFAELAIEAYGIDKIIEAISSNYKGRGNAKKLPELVDALNEHLNDDGVRVIETYGDEIDCAKEKLSDSGYAVIKVDNYEDQHLLKQFVRSTIVTHSLSFENNCLFPS